MANLFPAVKRMNELGVECQHATNLFRDQITSLDYDATIKEDMLNKFDNIIKLLCDALNISSDVLSHISGELKCIISMSRETHVILEEIYKITTAKMDTNVLVSTNAKIDVTNLKIFG
jgi:hypothetical protein